MNKYEQLRINYTCDQPLKSSSCRVIEGVTLVDAGLTTIKLAVGQTPDGIWLCGFSAYIASDDGPLSSFGKHLDSSFGVFASKQDATLYHIGMFLSWGNALPVKARRQLEDMERLLTEKNLFS